MRIGVDFDNTIVDYDGVFHAAALDRGLIPADLPRSKTSVRDVLNGSGRMDAFTELQGHVYGTRMDLARLHPGVRAFVTAAVAAGHDLALVSHKTRHPMLGPRHDLHAAARGFLVANGLVGAEAFRPDRIFFEERKEEKVARIAALGCDAFVDDLPEILAMPGFPPATRRILFDPDGHHAAGSPHERHAGWDTIAAALLGPGR